MAANSAASERILAPAAVPAFSPTPASFPPHPLEVCPYRRGSRSAAAKQNGLDIRLDGAAHRLCPVLKPRQGVRTGYVVRQGGERRSVRYREGPNSAWRRANCSRRRTSSASAVSARVASVAARLLSCSARAASASA